MRTYLLAAILCIALGSHFTAFAAKHQNDVHKEKTKDEKKKKNKKKEAKRKAKKKKAKKKEKKNKEQKNKEAKAQKAKSPEKKVPGARISNRNYQKHTPPRADGVQIPAPKTDAVSEQEKSETSFSHKTSSSHDSSSQDSSRARSSSFPEVSSHSSQFSEPEEIVCDLDPDPEVIVCDLGIERNFDAEQAAETAAETLAENARIFMVFEDSSDTNHEKNQFVRSCVKIIADKLLAHPKNFDLFLYGVQRADDSLATNPFDFANVNKYDPTDPEFINDPLPIARNLDLGMETFIENPDVCYSGFYFGGQTADAFIAGAKQHDTAPTLYPVFYPSVQYIGWYNGPNEVAPLEPAQGGAFGDTFIIQ